MSSRVKYSLRCSLLAKSGAPERKRKSSEGLNFDNSKNRKTTTGSDSSSSNGGSNDSLGNSQVVVSNRSGDGSGGMNEIAVLGAHTGTTHPSQHSSLHSPPSISHTNPASEPQCSVFNSPERVRRCNAYCSPLNNYYSSPVSSTHGYNDENVWPPSHLAGQSPCNSNVSNAFSSPAYERNFPPNFPVFDTPQNNGRNHGSSGSSYFSNTPVAPLRGSGNSYLYTPLAISPISEVTSRHSSLLNDSSPVPSAHAYSEVKVWSPSYLAGQSPCNSNVSNAFSSPAYEGNFPPNSPVFDTPQNVGRNHGSSCSSYTSNSPVAPLRGSGDSYLYTPLAISPISKVTSRQSSLLTDSSPVPSAHGYSDENVWPPSHLAGQSPCNSNVSNAFSSPAYEGNFPPISPVFDTPQNVGRNHGSSCSSYTSNSPVAPLRGSGDSYLYTPLAISPISEVTSRHSSLFADREGEQVYSSGRLTGNIGSNFSDTPYYSTPLSSLSIHSDRSLSSSLSSSGQGFASVNAKRKALLAEPFYVCEGSPDLINLIPDYDAGSLSGCCQFCKALYFPGEVTKDEKVYTNCCQKGKISINRSQYFPQYLHDLYSGKSVDSNHFMQNIRRFNSAFAFASFGYQSEKVPGRGPYCLKIGGNIHHKMSTSVNPIRNELDGNENLRSYCQVYILDTQEATRARFQHPANENLLYDVMENLHNLLKKEHPFAKSLYNMKDLMDKEKALAIEENRHIVNYTLRILDCKQARDDFRGAHDVVTSNEVAFIYKSIDDDQPPGFMNRAIHSRSSDKLQYLPRHSSKIDTFTYPLFFPMGEDNWIPSDENDDEKRATSMQKWYKYALQIRPESEGFSPILIGGKLTDQFVSDVRLRIEGRNIDFFRKNQAKLRVESYVGLHEHLRKTANMQKQTSGRVYVLPSSFTGGPRYMSALYNDAMSMVSELGFPDFFITMTCNPKWKEIQDNLGFAKSPDQRKDLTARVFKLKLDELLKDILEGHLFGKVRGYNCSIEFQKRGLPHAHIIVILDKAAKPRFAKDVDKHVSAELPNEKVHPELFSRVREFMIHGPCDVGQACWKNVNGKFVCKKKFPKAFQERTDFDVDSYPVYQRRDNKGKCADWKKKTIDNSYVVPYNPKLLMKYNCHINVEIVSSIKAIKYIYKYCFKGVDRLCFQVVEENTLNYDELTAYTNGRYLCASEAYWRIYEFDLFYRSHIVFRLPVHAEFMQSVVFREGKEQEAYESAEKKGTMLTAYFQLNREDPRARNLLYREIPLKYRWMKEQGYWQWYQRRPTKKIVRLHVCSPRDTERHSIRQLLIHRKGCISFEDLRTIDDVKFPSFTEAAKFLGLINTDESMKKLLDQAVLRDSPKRLRELLISFCSGEDTSKVVDIWTDYKRHIVEDFIHRGCSDEEAYDRGLIDISDGLLAMGTTLDKVGLPQPSCSYIPFEVPHRPDLEDIRRLCGLLNKDQLTAVQNVLRSVGRKCGKSFIQFSNRFFPQAVDSADPPKLFFLDGAGGTGKTFVYTVLCKIFEYSEIKHITVAPTGIAASILPNGRTAHSKFGIPLDLSKGHCSSISFDDPKADEIRDAKVVIWDEIGMTKRKMLEITNQLFLDVRVDHNGRRYSELFGGCVVVAGGDFRQQGPVVKRGNRVDFLKSCVKSSVLWPSFKKLTLHVNMRASSADKDYGAFLLKVGDNSLPKPSCKEVPPDFMEVPSEYLIDSSKNKDALIDFIFGKDLSDCDPLDFTNRAILCPRNADALRMNEVILTRLPGETVTSYSVDVAEFENDNTFDVITEYLNALTPSGCPPHKLNLKLNCVVMLLRNMNPRIGLVNGTRLIVKFISQNLLECEILCGAHKGERVYLPKLEITPLDTDLPFQFRRTQFPVRLCYAMTIAKSQGQSLEYVGLYLNSHSFCHGQIYTAMSRCKFPKNLKIDVVNSFIKYKGKIYIKNVVYKELL